MRNVLKKVACCLFLVLLIILPKVSSAGEPVIGKNYDYKNIDEIKEWISEARYNIIKDYQKWGVVNLIPQEAHKVPHHPGYDEATKKYAGNVKIVAEGGALEGWVAGCPFPDPLKGTDDPWEIGMRLLWNFEHRDDGDTSRQWYEGGPCDRRGVSGRVVVNEYKKWYVGRYARDPKPSMPKEKNPDNRYWANAAFVVEPFEMRNTNMLTIRYEDPYKDDDMWLYIPALRRIRRFSSAQRMDCGAATPDWTWDDYNFFQGKLANYKAKYIGRRWLLEGLVQSIEGKKPTDRIMNRATDHWFTDVKVEKVHTYEWEFYPKESVWPKHIYSKCVCRSDPDHWRIIDRDTYDAKGRLWKVGYYYFLTNPEPGQEGLLWACGEQVDVQRMHSSNGNAWATYDPHHRCRINNLDLPLSYFEASGLRKYGY